MPSIYDTEAKLKERHAKNMAAIPDRFKVYILVHLNEYDPTVMHCSD
jgi:hypothetical protein